MKLSPKKFFSRFFIITIATFVIHCLLYRAFSSTFGYGFQTLVEIYIFLIVLSAFHFFALLWLFKKWPKYSGFIFTGFSLLKMAASVLYLFPYIMPAKDDSIPIALSFMVLYFILLTYEVIFIARSMVKNL